MAKPKRDDTARGGAAEGPAGGGGLQAVGIATLAGVAVLIGGTFLIWNDTRSIESQLDERLRQIETRVALLSDKMDAVAARPAAPAPRQGPSPERVYQVRTDGAPARGPASAPITIVEFSDFQ